ncbi:MAG: hypothetical protein JO032_20945 [Alphaproteobacteria bacterium]|nr:hypothetical protein [Alphaproteobacteria bacterium]MBV9555255.1 hypothetical protein [Alphaproteobacteria bacterium]
MDERDEIADAVALLLRYQIAKAAVFRPGEDFEIPPTGPLVDDIERLNGQAVIDGCLHVMTWMSPPLVGDDEKPEFFRAVVWEEDDALDFDPEPLEALRRYVLRGSPGPFLRIFGASLCLRVFDPSDPQGSAHA